MTTALTGARIFDGTRIVDGYAVIIDGERIAAVVPEREAPAGARKVAGLIAPGFIDVQINGGGGILFNDAPTVAGIAAIGAAHRAHGVTGFLPTLITDTREQMSAAIAAARSAISAKVPGALGIHVEGPFISLERKGVHAARFIRAMEAEDIAILCQPTGGKTLVTLAPEVVPPATIRQLAAAGVIVAAGHTAASSEQVAAARAAGLTGFTHLYNAMPPLAGRAPGPVGAALDDAEAWASIIADLHHVSAQALRVAIAARGWQRTMLVSDAMPTVGADLAEFTLHGRTVRLAGGKLTTEDGGLAGAHLAMDMAVRNAVAGLGLPLEAALAHGVAGAGRVPRPRPSLRPRRAGLRRVAGAARRRSRRARNLDRRRRLVEVAEVLHLVAVGLQDAQRLRLAQPLAPRSGLAGDEEAIGVHRAFAEGALFFLALELVERRQLDRLAELLGRRLLAKVRGDRAERLGRLRQHVLVADDENGRALDGRPAATCSLQLPQISKAVSCEFSVAKPGVAITSIASSMLRPMCFASEGATSRGSRTM